MRTVDLSGAWECSIPGFTGVAALPGTLDENGIGFPDAVKRPWHPDAPENKSLSAPGPIATRFTRICTYEGPAVFRRTLSADLPVYERVFLEVERARCLTVLVNGREAPRFGPQTLSAPQSFELTGLLTGRDELTLISDNSYPGLPAADIECSSAATDETQTNWNGLLGYVRLAFRGRDFISSLRVYPRGDRISVRWDISGDAAGDVTLDCPAVAGPVTVPASGGGCDLPLLPGVRRWDLDRGELYPMTARFGGEAVTVKFGVRDFGALDGRFALNGRKVFLRCEANCAAFPETGRPPMDVESWRRIMAAYRAYGVNTVRFHSHCPPEAAFAAADEAGMLIQAELSHWNPRDAFASEKSRRYYREELFAILRAYACHPSFVMLTLGNELHADAAGHSCMGRLLRDARDFDPTRLYAQGSNNHYGALPLDADSDFYTSFSYMDKRLRGTYDGMAGWINDPDRDLDADYREAVEAIHAVRPVPVCSFEVGQFEVLPEFSELSEFRGVTRPDNLALIREKAERRGLLPAWDRYVEATGELSLLGYRLETEAALRTAGMGGISLLGLQDFPGQGTALVGMMTSHLRPKPHPFAAPERFRAFFTDVLPLLGLKRATYAAGETVSARAMLANYGRRDICGAPEWRLEGRGAALSGTLPPATAPAGELVDLGWLEIPLGRAAAPEKLRLTLAVAGFENSWDIWVYPASPRRRPEGVWECRSFDADTLAHLSAGGRVLLSPKSDRRSIRGAVKGQFTTDFWSVGTFPSQEGGMGLLIREDHPIFRAFPTSFHTDLQWRRLAGMCAAPLPAGAGPIVTLMDSYAYMRDLAYIFECRCGGGRLLVSTFGLSELGEYPEARALEAAIWAYAASEDFAPAGEAAPASIAEIFPAQS